MKTNYYSKNKLSDDGTVYYTIQVEEKIEKEAVVVMPHPDNVFTVIATGAYGYIKVKSNGIMFTLSNPFTKDSLGHITDRRSTFVHIAEPVDRQLPYVLNMAHAKFNLSPKEMAELHTYVYIADKTTPKPYWINL